MCVRCHQEGVFDCDVPGYDCMAMEVEFYDDQPSADVMDIINQQTIESEVSMSKKTDKVEITEEVKKDAIIKKQSEVWVYDDEVYATYEKAVAAKLKTSIAGPLVAAYYKRQGNYSDAQIASYTASAKTNKNFMVYLDDVVKLLPEFIAKLDA